MFKNINHNLKANMTTDKQLQKLLDNIDTIDVLDREIQKGLVQKNNSHNFIKRNGNYNLTPHIEVDVKQEKLRVADINQQMPKLEQDIFEIRSGVTIELLLKHQNTIVEAQTEIDGYQKLIGEQQQVIEKANSVPDLTMPLMVKREDLLCDIAIGKDKTSELKKLDSEIETVQTDLSAKRAYNRRVISQAEQTINGLNRLVSDTQERISILQGYTPKIIDAYLMAKASQAVIDFNAIAESINQKFTELVALDRVVNLFGQRKNTGFFYKEWQIKIPLLANNKPIPYIEINGSSHHCVDSDTEAFIKNANCTIEKLKQDLINQGVDINAQKSRSFS